MSNFNETKAYACYNKESNELDHIALYNDHYTQENYIVKEIPLSTSFTPANIVATSTMDMVNGVLSWSQGMEIVAYITTSHRYLQNHYFCEVILPLLHKMSMDYDNGNYDPRNEFACKVANAMYKGAITNGVIYESEYSENDFKEEYDKALYKVR